MRYETQDDAELYLSGSFVRWNETVVYIQRVLSALTASVIKLNGSEQEVLIEELSSEPIKIGYYRNRQGTLHYLERTPSRSWRQGLTSSNISTRGTGRGRFSIPGFGEEELERLFFPETNSLVDMHTLAVGNRREEPFTRTLSVDHIGLIRYKTRTVGVLNENSIGLFSHFSYLKELIEETTNESINIM